MKSKPTSQASARLPQLPECVRCPISGKPLKPEEGGDWVRVVGEPIRYPVRGGIPVLVPAAAERTDA